MGGLPNAIYTLDAASPTSGLAATKLTMLRTNAVSCNPQNPPSDVLRLQYLFSADSTGANIDARPAGVSSPVSAKAYIVGVRDGVLAVDHPSGLAVTFNGVAGTTKGDGLYTAKLSLPLGNNIVSIQAVSGSLTQ